MEDKKELKYLRKSLAVDKMLLLEAMLESRDVKIFKNCQSLGGESCIRVRVDDISLSVYKKHGLFGNVYYSIDGMRLAPHVHEKLLQKMRFCCAAQQREKLRLESARVKACRHYVTCLNSPELRELIINYFSPIMADMEDKNKKAAACCNKRAADRAKELTWLDSALLVEFEKKLLQDADGLFGFLRGEEDEVFSLLDYDVSFVVDSEFRPQRWLNGECGVHAFTIQVSVRGGKVVSYVVRGNGPRQVYGRVFSNR